MHHEPWNSGQGNSQLPFVVFQTFQTPPCGCGAPCEQPSLLCFHILLQNGWGLPVPPGVPSVQSYLRAFALAVFCPGHCMTVFQLFSLLSEAFNLENFPVLLYFL